MSSFPLFRLINLGKITVITGKMLSIKVILKFNNLFMTVPLLFRAAGIKYICDFESPFGPRNKERTAAMVFTVHTVHTVHITQRIYI
jgi:hypothetical protein